jgi:hypothetical protein
VVERIMLAISGIQTFALLLAVHRTFAASCSAACFESGGSLDPKALTDPDLFGHRVFHSCT